MTAKTTPFAKYDADASGASTIVMGLKDENDDVVASVRLPAGGAAAALMSVLEPEYAVSSGGFITLETDTIDDREHIDLLQSGALPKASLADLVSEYIALARNVPDEEDVEDFERLAGLLEKLSRDLRDAAAKAQKED